MDKIKVVSFDAEGTLVASDFSQAVWHEGIPSLYAKMKGISFREAKALVEKEYDKVGEGKREWYDIKYWFERFQLGDYQPVLETHKHKAACYPEAPQVLSALGNAYTLVVTTSSAREFLPYLLNGLDEYLDRVFSSISDYGQLKSPQFYATVCREMCIKPGEMIHVGDSWQFDFLAATEAGIKAFHLDRGPEPEEGGSLTSLEELRAKLLGD